MKNYIVKNIDFIVYLLFFSVILLLFMLLIHVSFGTAITFVMFLFVIQFFAKMIFNGFFRFLRGVMGKNDIQ